MLYHLCCSRLPQTRLPRPLRVLSHHERPPLDACCFSTPPVKEPSQHEADCCSTDSLSSSNKDDGSRGECDVGCARRCGGLRDDGMRRGVAREAESGTRGDCAGKCHSKGRGRHRLATRMSCWQGEHARGASRELTLTSVYQRSDGATGRGRGVWASCGRSTWEGDGADAIPHITTLA